MPDEWSQDNNGSNLDLLQFTGRAALHWGHADVLALGPDQWSKRVGELAALFAIRGDKDGKLRASAVWLILPPARTQSADVAVKELREAVADALTRVSQGRASDAGIIGVLDAITPMSALTFDGDALVELLKHAPAKTGVIVADAHRFRFAARSRAENSQIEEDVWSANVHQLLVNVGSICREGERYVVLDLGTYSPSRQANIDLLCSVEEVGVTGIVLPGPSGEDIAARVARWFDAAKAGEVGQVIKEVEEDADLSELQRFFLKLEAFSTSGIHDQVRNLLRDNTELLGELTASQNLNIARIAEAAADTDRAEALIRAAMPSIRSERDFEHAFTTALKTARRGLVTAVQIAFRTLFPNSPRLRRYEVVESARAGEYRRAAQLLAAPDNPEEAQRARYYELLDAVMSEPGWDPAAVYKAVSEAIPDMADEAAIDITRALEREKRRADAIGFALELDPKLGGETLIRLIRIAGRGLQAGELAPSDPSVEQLVYISLACLGQDPGNGVVRMGLATLMAPTMTGSTGLAVLFAAVLKRAVAPPTIRERPKIADRPQPISAEELVPRLERIWRWIGTRGEGVHLVGHHRLPANELDVPADQVLAAILKAVDYHGARIAHESDGYLMTLYVAAASAIAPLAAEPDDDLTIVRAAGSKLAIAGKGQAARDLAEFALQSAGSRPERRRKALFSFADIYARLGMRTEALIALGAAFDASSVVTWDEVWFETNLMFRLLRDAGMAALGLPLLKRSRRALDAIGLSERDGYRLETFALQAATAAFDEGGGDDAQLAELLKAAEENAKQVLAATDDLLPIAMVLNTLLRLAQTRNLQGTDAVEALMEELAAGLPHPQQRMVRGARPTPALADIAALAASIDEARYVEDTGYDLRHLRVMARRLVSQAIEAVDPKVLTYAIEASSDHAIAVRQRDGTKMKGERLLAREDAPLEAAERLSQAGAAIVGMALLEDRLATVEFEDGTVTDFTLEPTAVFSANALHRWNERYPWDYRLEDKCLSREDVWRSMAAIGVTKLPKRSVIIADAQLQRLPPNLLMIDGNHAGFDHAIAAAPSLEWLAASRGLDRRGDGSARMWIPISSGHGTEPLTLLHDEIHQLLSREQVALELGGRPTANFAEVDVAIVGAHGGLVSEDNQFFRSVSNDDHTLTKIADMTETIRHARLAILFVCSGGRIDPHPETGMAVGLAKLILARGCSAVIAPAWPIPVFLARPWLEGFLPEWRKGVPLLDAYHAGNLSVARSSSWDPKRTLAMTLYGDPFLRAG